MGFEIVRCDSKHQEPLIDLWKECNLIVPQNDPVKDIKKKLEFQPELFFVAMLDNRLVGSIMVGYEGHRGWLNYLAVLPRYQKMGYGKKLVERAIVELKKLGCLKLNVQIRESNVAAVAFYERLDFKKDHVISFGLRLDEGHN